jgi:hypothetical protein
VPTLQQSLPETLEVSNLSNTDSNYQSQSITHVAKFKPHSIVVFKKFEGFQKSKTEQELANLDKGKNGEYNGYMSPTTSRKVRSLLENWLMALEYNITRGWSMTVKEAMENKKIKQEYAPTFITLTLPSDQIHEDNFIKKNMLWAFIQEVQRKHGVKYYFWRAEPQANGRIHFHILVDKYIHWTNVRKIWNNILDNNGYIERYRQNQIEKHKNGFAFDKEQCNLKLLDIAKKCEKQGIKFEPKAERNKEYQRQLRAYESGTLTNWSDGNSTDIHSIMNVKSITAYVVKYVTKDKDQSDKEGVSTRTIDGRIWGCSDELRNLKHYEITIAEEIDYRTIDYDTREIEVVIGLERTLDKNDIIRDSEAGILILMLRENKLYDYLKANHKEVFQSYKNHYQFMFISLYRPEIIHEYLSITLYLSEIINSFTIDKLNTPEKEDNNEQIFAVWEQIEMDFNDVPF